MLQGCTYVCTWRNRDADHVQVQALSHKNAGKPLERNARDVQTPLQLDARREEGETRRVLRTEEDARRVEEEGEVREGGPLPGPAGRSAEAGQDLSSVLRGPG